MNAKQEILDNLSFNVEAFSSRFEFVVSELRKSCLFNRVIGNTTIENSLIAAAMTSLLITSKRKVVNRNIYRNSSRRRFFTFHGELTKVEQTT